MYDFSKFTLGEMTECGVTLRKLGVGESSMEAVANKIVRYFHTQFLDPNTGKSALALVRFFKTHSYRNLPIELRQIADQTLGYCPTQDELKCLTLLATAGDRPEWNERTASLCHQVIPLPSEHIVAQAPMISQLIKQLGLSISDVIAPDSDLLVDLHERTYSVFHVPEAQGSPYIPAQNEFVRPHQIRSVLGFGGILPSGNLMVIVLFSKLKISREVAELFRPLSLNAKMTVLPFGPENTFESIGFRALFGSAQQQDAYLR
ncbi:MAG: hypothetical protein ACFBSF_01975 [Leptolyngbyaceae cyanobacterium]